MCTLRRKDQEAAFRSSVIRVPKQRSVTASIAMGRFFQGRLIREKTQTFTLNGETNLRVLGLSMLPVFYQNHCRGHHFLVMVIVVVHQSISKSITIFLIEQCFNEIGVYYISSFTGNICLFIKRFNKPLLVC